MNKTRYFLTSSLILLLLASTSILALSARSNESGKAANASPGALNFTHLQGGHYSGDDLYDPAVIQKQNTGAVSASGNDAYDLTTTRNLDISALKDGGNYSGDDTYDLASSSIRRTPAIWSSRNYSGDDVYDLATIRSLDTSVFDDNGNYSGDDLYDAAAGR
ncbi:hypothetical protein ACFLXI_03905 [Chloroflexota bacterium]